MLSGCDVVLNTDFNKDREALRRKAKKVVYTGPLDAYFDGCCGPLEYRSLRFDTRRLDTANHQGVAVMNYTDRETPYTRVIEHKHFEFGSQPVTWVTWEYPEEWKPGESRITHQRREKTRDVRRIQEWRRREKDVVFAGGWRNIRLDMDRPCLALAWRKRNSAERQGSGPAFAPEASAPSW